MTREEHVQRHKELHKALDELVADMITHTKLTTISKTTLIELMRWSKEQCDNPTMEGGEANGSTEPTSVQTSGN